MCSAHQVHESGSLFNRYLTSGFALHCCQFQLKSTHIDVTIEEKVHFTAFLNISMTADESIPVHVFSAEGWLVHLVKVHAFVIKSNDQ